MDLTEYKNRKNAKSEIDAINEAERLSPTEKYFRKVDLFATTDGQLNLLNRWQNLHYTREAREGEILRILIHNFPHDIRIFNDVMSKHLPWGSQWISGINHTFDTLLTRDMFNQNFFSLRHTKSFGVQSDDTYIKWMVSNGKKGQQIHAVQGVPATSFKEIYEILTNPINANLYRKLYIPKSITGKPGRPVEDGTFIEFTMKKMPIMMIRGKDPFRNEDRAMQNCYAMVGLQKPDKDKQSVSQWIVDVKKTFKKTLTTWGFDVKYQSITPCSLEYWMKEIERREFSNQLILGAARTRKRIFKASTRLQLRSNGSYRFYSDDLENNDEGWLPDPMQIKELVDIMPDETNALTENNNSNFDKVWDDILFENEVLEAKGIKLTPEEKMDRWHNGTRRENIKACSEDKLKEYRKICKAKGYDAEVRIINAELKARKSAITESVSYDNLTQNGYIWMNKVVTNLNSCRNLLDAVIYNNGLVDEDKDDDIKEIYNDICKILDKIS